MYEIWSVGHKPFENITNSEVCQKLAYCVIEIPQETSMLTMCIALEYQLPLCIPIMLFNKLLEGWFRALAIPWATYLQWQRHPTAMQFCQKYTILRNLSPVNFVYLPCMLFYANLTRDFYTRL